MQNTSGQRITISGSVENIVYCNSENGYAVIDISTDNNELLTAVGTLSNLCVGESVKLHGFFKTHINFGMQFKVDTYEVSLPENKKAVLKYLQSGALPYIGNATAKKIVDTFGDDALEIIATDANSLSKIKGISYNKATAIQNEFKRMYGIRETMVYCASLGIDAGAAAALYNIYGQDTNDVIKDNPYVLCGYPEFLDFGFVDKIAADMLMEYNSSERVVAGIIFVLRHNLQNGHTCLPIDKLVNSVSAYLHVEPENIKENITYMVEQNTISEEDVNGRTFLFLPEYLSAERYIASALRYIAKLPGQDVKYADNIISKLEIINNINYAPLQRTAIINALSTRALVLTGGPGTGKTTTVNGIISAFEQQGDRVALCAPTGRAAKRLSELTSRKATTIHRLLEVDFSDKVTVRFIHNENNLLRHDVVVVDEMSMVDVLLFQSLLCALKPSCKIIMVGDEEQLPSVGAGSVLSSIIASGVVSTVRLKEIFRQAAQSDIVSNAHRIVEGQKLELSGRDSDFFVLEQSSAAECAELVCDLVSKRLPKSYSFDSMEDIQVLCPTKIGAVGTASLNTMLQDKINPPGSNKGQIKLNDRILRLGDKVMQIKNNYDIPFIKESDAQEGAGAFNGDMGIIIKVDERANTVTVKSEDRILEYTSEFLYELEPAYAVTIHKSQGSEFSSVIIPLFDVPPKLSYRNLLYTGVTRAKKLCIIAGKSFEATKMIENAKQSKRYSCLVDFLKE